MVWVLLTVGILVLVGLALVAGSRTPRRSPGEDDWMRYADPGFGTPGGADATDAG